MTTFNRGSYYGYAQIKALVSDITEWGFNLLYSLTAKAHPERSQMVSEDGWNVGMYPDSSYRNHFRKRIFYNYKIHGRNDIL